MRPHPSLLSFLLAIIVIAAVVADIVVLHSLLGRPQSEKQSPLQPMDIWSQSRFGVWWACRLTRWLIYAIFIAYIGNFSGAIIGAVLAVILAGRDIARYWR